MSKRIGLAFVIVILMTVAIMQNPEDANFKLILFSAQLPKLVVMTAMAAGGFITGILVMLRKSRTNSSTYENHNDTRSNEHSSNTLSDEDRDYISEP